MSDVLLDQPKSLKVFSQEYLARWKVHQSTLEPKIVQEKPVVESNGIESSCQRFSVHRITPYEWSNPHPCKSDPDELETDFTASNALWFGIGSFLCQGSDILPK